MTLILLILTCILEYTKGLKVRLQVRPISIIMTIPPASFSFIHYRDTRLWNTPKHSLVWEYILVGNYSNNIISRGKIRIHTFFLVNLLSHIHHIIISQKLGCKPFFNFIRFIFTGVKICIYFIGYFSIHTGKGRW